MKGETASRTDYNSFDKYYLLQVQQLQLYGSNRTKQNKAHEKFSDRAVVVVVTPGKKDIVCRNCCI